MGLLNRIASGVAARPGIDPVTGAAQTTPWAWKTADGMYADPAGRDVWLYMALPTAPFANEDPETRLGIGAPLRKLLAELGELSKAPAGGVRHLSSNREIHLLAISWVVPPVPPAGISDDLAAFQAEAFAGFSVPEKVVLIGVKLRPGLGFSVGVRGVIAGLFDWADESAVVDFAAYDADRARIEEILGRHGAAAMTAGQAARLESWFNDGGGPEAHIIEHPDRVEVPGCGEDWEFSAVVGFSDPLRRALNFDWAAVAAVEGAAVISVRAALEPWSVTRGRARSAQRRLREQIDEQHATGDLERSEDWTTAGLAKQAEDYWAHAKTASLTEASIIFARPRATERALTTFRDEIQGRYGVEAVVLTHRQVLALDETMPCSTRRLGQRRPFSQDLNVEALAYAGFTAFSGLGDDTGPFIGLATPDMVPVHLDPSASARTDQPPTLAIVGQPGSGKTFLSQSISVQAVLDGRRAVFINPKSHDSLRPFADAVGGETVSLAQLEGGEPGAFDPFRFAPTPEMAAEIAGQYILSVLTGFTEAQELALTDGLRRGAENGARCVIEALEDVVDADVRDRVRAQASSSTLFALGIAGQDQGQLGVTAGLTLVEFDRPLDLPSPTATPGEHTRDQRIAMAAVRLVTRASIEILMRPRTDGTVGRDGGVLVVDEAWVFLQHPSSQAVLERLAREGRSMGLLLVLATQKVADVLDGGIADYLSRVMALRLTERKEAEAALTLAGFEPTEDLIGFLRDDAGPRRPTAGSPGRPPLGLHRDAHGRRAIVMLGPTPPKWALAFSTNPEDRAARAARVDDTGPGMVAS